MKSKESRQTSKAPVVDVSQRIRELRAIRAEIAVLREGLFHACCNLQHDADSVDLRNLSVLVFKLRTVEEKREALETALASLLLAHEAE